MDTWRLTDNPRFWFKNKDDFINTFKQSSVLKVTLAFILYGSILFQLLFEQTDSMINLFAMLLLFFIQELNFIESL